MIFGKEFFRQRAVNRLDALAERLATQAEKTPQRVLLRTELAHLQAHYLHIHLGNLEELVKRADVFHSRTIRLTRTKRYIDSKRPVGKVTTEVAKERANHITMTFVTPEKNSVASIDQEYSADRRTGIFQTRRHGRLHVTVDNRLATVGFTITRRFFGMGRRQVAIWRE